MATLNQSEEPKLEDSNTSATMSCAELYKEFLKIEEHCEDSVESIISNFDALISKLKTNDDGNDNDNDNNNHSHLQYLNNLELIRSMTTTHSLPFKYKKLLHLGKKSIFINRFNKYYKTNDYSILSKTKTLIIGCGPSGLRMAIELALYGNKNIELIDSRDSWSRKQIVAIWNITESDLISFGIRDLLPKFTKNPHKKSVPITFLQHFLLRICLILGIKIRTNIEFKGIDFRKNKINLYNKNTQKLEQYTNDYDILLDATGTVGALRDCPIITHRHSLSSMDEQDDETKDDNESPPTQRSARSQSQSQSQSRSRSESKEKEEEHGVEIIGSRKGSCLKKDVFGIVANFKRIRGDHKIEQILGKSYHFYQKEFDSKEIRLENIVYYRSDLTNYLVATVKKESLIAHNIFIQHKLRGKRLLKRENVNKDNLRDMILKVGKEWNIPHSKKRNPFNILSKGTEDFAVFEFGKLKIAKQPIKFIQRQKPYNIDDDHKENDNKSQTQMIACIGDAECAPFWPKGTGVNHAFIGIYLMMDVITKWVKDKYNDDIEYLNEMEINTKKEFDVLHSDLNDKIWHKKRIGNTYLPEYKAK